MRDEDQSQIIQRAIANRFARCLLLPSKEFIKWFYRSDGDIDFLAEIFFVEKKRIAERITDLDLWEEEEQYNE